MTENRDVECAELRLEVARAQGLIVELSEKLAAAEVERDDQRRLREAAEKDRDSHKHNLETYANAWTRELGSGPWIRGKRHEIDALVLSTKAMRELAEQGIRTAKAWEILGRMRAVWNIMRTADGFARDAASIALVVKFMSEVCDEAHKEAP